MYIFYFLFISLAFSCNLYVVFVCLLCFVCLLVVVFYGLVLVGDVCLSVLLLFWSICCFLFCVYRSVFAIFLFVVILMLAIFNILNNNNNNNYI